MTEAVPADLLLYAHPFECRPNVTLKNHVRRERLRSVLRHGREEEILVGPIEGRLPPVLQFFNDQSWKWCCPLRVVSGVCPLRIAGRPVLAYI